MAASIEEHRLAPYLGAQKFDVAAAGGGQRRQIVQL
jgi:hypothetical protein